MTDDIVFSFSHDQAIPVLSSMMNSERTLASHYLNLPLPSSGRTSLAFSSLSLASKKAHRKMDSLLLEAMSPSPIGESVSVEDWTFVVKPGWSGG